MNSTAGLNTPTPLEFDSEEKRKRRESKYSPYIIIKRKGKEGEFGIESLDKDEEPEGYHCAHCKQTLALWLAKEKRTNYGNFGKHLKAKHKDMYLEISPEEREEIEAAEARKSSSSSALSQAGADRQKDGLVLNQDVKTELQYLTTRAHIMSNAPQNFGESPGLRDLFVHLGTDFVPPVANTVRKCTLDMDEMLHLHFKGYLLDRVNYMKSIGIYGAVQFDGWKVNDEEYYGLWMHLFEKGADCNPKKILFFAGLEPIPREIESCDGPNLANIILQLICKTGIIPSPAVTELVRVFRYAITDTTSLMPKTVTILNLWWIPCLAHLAFLALQDALQFKKTALNKAFPGPFTTADVIEDELNENTTILQLLMSTEPRYNTPESVSLRDAIVIISSTAAYFNRSGKQTKNYQQFQRERQISKPKLPLTYNETKWSGMFITLIRHVLLVEKYYLNDFIDSLKNDAGAMRSKMVKNGILFTSPHKLAVLKQFAMVLAKLNHGMKVIQTEELNINMIYLRVLADVADIKDKKFRVLDPDGNLTSIEFNATLDPVVESFRLLLVQFLEERIFGAFMNNAAALVSVFGSPLSLRYISNMQYARLSEQLQTATLAFCEIVQKEYSAAGLAVVSQTIQQTYPDSSDSKKIKLDSRFESPVKTTIGSSVGQIYVAEIRNYMESVSTYSRIELPEHQKLKRDSLFWEANKKEYGIIYRMYVTALSAAAGSTKSESTFSVLKHLTSDEQQSLSVEVFCAQCFIKANYLPYDEFIAVLHQYLESKKPIHGN